MSAKNKLPFVKRLRLKLKREKLRFPVSDPFQTNEYVVGKSRVGIGRFTYGYEMMRVNEWSEGANLHIGAFCSIASGLEVFLGGNHKVDWVTTFPFGHKFGDELGGQEIKGHPHTNGDVTIGNDVWIGANATILSGVTIGDGAVVGANSTVVKDVPPYTIVGGNPAKALKLRFGQEIVDRLLVLKWWELPVEQVKTLVPLLSSQPTLELFTEIENMVKKQTVQAQSGI